MLRRVVVVGLAVTVLAVALLFWMRGTSGPDALAGIGPADGAPFLRLTVEVDQDADVVRILAHDLIRTATPPVLGTGRYYAVLDGPEGALAATPVSVAREVVQEQHTNLGVTAQIIPLTRSATVVYLPFEPQATGVRIVDRRGSVQASLDSAALGRLQAAARRSGATPWQRVRDMVETPVHAATLADLQAAYPHIKFVTNRSELTNEKNKNLVTRVRTDEPEVADRLLRALNFMSHELSGSIAALAVADFVPAVNVLSTTGDLDCHYSSTRGQAVGTEVVLNVSSVNIADCALGPTEWTEMAHTLAHEAAHAFTNLSDHIDRFSAGELFLDTDTLPADILLLVRTTQKNLGGKTGAFSGSFAQLQQTAPRIYSGYLPYGRPSLTQQAAVAGGFATAYGGTNEREDLAEYVQVFFSPRASEFTHPVCTQFAGLNRTIPRQSLVAFAKVSFLRGVGLIEENQYRACVQNADPATEEGFRVNNVDFDRDIKVDMISPGVTEPSRLVVLGASSQSQLMLQILAKPPFYSPLGFHKLDLAQGWITPYLKDKAFDRRNQLTLFPLNPANDTDRTRQSRISTGGFALITHYLPGEATGYLFFVPMEDWMERQVGFYDVIWFKVQ